MFYARLCTKEPYFEFVENKTDKALYDIAKEFIKHNPADPEPYTETVSPQGFHRFYGFVMDEEAISHQREINPIATALYNMTLVGGWHPILGNAIVGKWVQDETGCKQLDFFDEKDCQQVYEFICDAIDMIKARSKYKS